MNTRSSAANIAQATKQLSAAWDQTRIHWRDVKSQEFEHKFLADLPGQVAKASAVIEELDTLLRKVKSDCE